jgi:hypothetical protein
MWEADLLGDEELSEVNWLAGYRSHLETGAETTGKDNGQLRSMGQSHISSGVYQ